MRKVIKRDDTSAQYDPEKIRGAVTKANGRSCEMSDADIDGIVASVGEKAEDGIHVEEIQNLVEKALMERGFYATAKQYILYRDMRTRNRENKSKLMRDIAKKLYATNVVNQNANLDEKSFGGRKGEASGELMKWFALENCMSKKSRDNHLNNEIYIHDLDSYALGEHNCTDGDSWVKIKTADSSIRYMRVRELANELGLTSCGELDISGRNYFILSRNGWTKLNSITGRLLNKDESLYVIRTKAGLPLRLTAKHRLPVIRNGSEILSEVSNVKIGDSLLSVDNCSFTKEDISNNFLNLSKIDSALDIRIANISKLKQFLRYKYDITFNTYINGIGEIDSNRAINDSITKSEFERIVSDFSLSFDVLSSLRIKVSGSKHTYPLLIPFDENLARLYGYIYADGSVYVNEKESIYQLGFFNTNPEIMENFLRAYENVFGYRMNISYSNEKSTSPCLRVTDGSKLVVSIFRGFAGAYKYGAADMSIPDFILNGSDAIKYAFLSACIDTDGSLSERCITYTTCGERYSEQLMLLLESLGYHPHRNLQYAKGSKYKVYKATGFRNYDCYVVRIERNDDIKRLYANINIIKHRETYAYLGTSSHIDYDQIISIDKISYDQLVYDFETGDHWFILNNYVSHNCLSIPFDKLLAEGFNTRQTDIRPANSINTAFQLVAVIFQIQSLQQFGGVSATHLDWTMVPYVRKSFRKHFIEGMHYIEGTDFDISDETHIDADEYKSHEKSYAYAMDMTEKELRQAAEGMMHNLNTLQSRSGNQLPFSSINYGTCALPEGRMVIRALLDASIKGVGKLHKTSIFPCGIFQYMKGVNDRPGTPNYDLYRLALQSTARRLYPNYANVNWSNNAGYDMNDPKTYFSTMGCRTANGSDINAEPGTNPQTKDGRGNLCPVTIIMPTLAMKAKEQDGDLVENFLFILDRKIHEAKDMLIERYEYMCKQSPDGARFMYENGTMLGYRPEEGIRSALRHGTLAIGQLGLAETLQILIGKNQLTDEGMALAKRIEALFRDRVDEFKHKYSLNFGVYYSPAENLCYTAMTKFKARYGVIPNVSDRDYFTNSMHVPVWEKVNAFEKIDCESQLTGYSNAGCITYVEADGSILHNIDALETVVNYAMGHDIPYFAVNVPNDTCLDCGYTGELNDECPVCHSSHIQQLRRVTGYLTGDYKSAFNKGKQAEVGDRVKHI